MWLCLCAAAVAVVQSPTIVVERSDHAIVAPGRFPSSPLTEPFPIVDPADPRHLVVGTIVAPMDDDSPWHCAVLVTWDDGATWTRHDFAIERCIDPWVTFTPEGSVLFVALEIQRGVTGDARFHLVSFRSEDGGRRWSDPPTSLGRAHEHPMLWSNPTGDSVVYLASRRMRRTADGAPRHRVGVFRSDDDGRSFRPVAEPEPGNVALNVTGLTRRDGRIAVGFWDYQRNVDGFGREGMLARGRSWLYLSRSDGAAFDPPRLITDDCASGIEGVFPGYPFLTGGPQGRLYHACVRPGLDGIALTHSADGGEVWSAPLRVDRPPADRPAHVRTAMLAVDPAGTVGVAWYDRRHDPDRECQDVYFTASTDGGRSVAPPVRITTETSCPGVPGNGRAGRSWAMGGDYSSLTAGPDGRFHLVWADSRSGRFALRRAVIEVR